MVGLLICLSLPFLPHDLQAFGNNLIATAVIAVALAWHILHPPAKIAGDLPVSSAQ
jgi:hypothetical protein